MPNTNDFLDIFQPIQSTQRVQTNTEAHAENGESEEEQQESSTIAVIKKMGDKLKSAYDEYQGLLDRLPKSEAQQVMNEGINQVLTFSQNVTQGLANLEEDHAFDSIGVSVEILFRCTDHFGKNLVRAGLGTVALAAGPIGPPVLMVVDSMILDPYVITPGFDAFEKFAKPLARDLLRRIFAERIATPQNSVDHSPYVLFVHCRFENDPFDQGRPYLDGMRIYSTRAVALENPLGHLQLGSQLTQRPLLTRQESDLLLSLKISSQFSQPQPVRESDSIFANDSTQGKSECSSSDSETADNLPKESWQIRYQNETFEIPPIISEIKGVRTHFGEPGVQAEVRMNNPNGVEIGANVTISRQTVAPGFSIGTETESTRLSGSVSVSGLGLGIGLSIQTSSPLGMAIGALGLGCFSTYMVYEQIKDYFKPTAIPNLKMDHPDCIALSKALESQRKLHHVEIHHRQQLMTLITRCQTPEHWQHDNAEMLLKSMKYMIREVPWKNFAKGYLSAEGPKEYEASLSRYQKDFSDDMSSILTAVEQGNLARSLQLTKHAIQKFTDEKKFVLIQQSLNNPRSLQSQAQFLLQKNNFEAACEFNERARHYSDSKFQVALEFAKSALANGHAQKMQELLITWYETRQFEDQGQPRAVKQELAKLILRVESGKSSHEQSPEIISRYLSDLIREDQQYYLKRALTHHERHTLVFDLDGSTNLAQLQSNEFKLLDYGIRHDLLTHNYFEKFISICLQSDNVDALSALAYDRMTELNSDNKIKIVKEVSDIAISLNKTANARNHDRAIQLMNKLVEEPLLNNEDKADCYWRLGQLKAKYAKYDRREVIAAYEKGYEANPNHLDLTLKLAHERFHTLRYEEAIAILQEHDNQNPNQRVKAKVIKYRLSRLRTQNIVVSSIFNVNRLVLNQLSNIKGLNKNIIAFFRHLTIVNSLAEPLMKVIVLEKEQSVLAEAQPENSSFTNWIFQRLSAYTHLLRSSLMAVNQYQPNQKIISAIERLDQAQDAFSLIAAVNQAVTITPDQNGTTALTVNIKQIPGAVVTSARLIKKYALEPMAKQGNAAEGPIGIAIEGALDVLSSRPVVMGMQAYTMLPVIIPIVNDLAQHIATEYPNVVLQAAPLIDTTIYVFDVVKTGAISAGQFVVEKSGELLANAAAGSATAAAGVAAVAVIGGVSARYVVWKGYKYYCYRNLLNNAQAKLDLAFSGQDPIHNLELALQKNKENLNSNPDDKKLLTQRDVIDVKKLQIQMEGTAQSDKGIVLAENINAICRKHEKEDTKDLFFSKSQIKSLMYQASACQANGDINSKNQLVARAAELNTNLLKIAPNDVALNYYSVLLSSLAGRTIEALKKIDALFTLVPKEANALIDELNQFKRQLESSRQQSIKFFHDAVSQGIESFKNYLWQPHKSTIDQNKMDPFSGLMTFCHEQKNALKVYFIDQQKWVAEVGQQFVYSANSFRQYQTNLSDFFFQKMERYLATKANHLDQECKSITQTIHEVQESITTHTERYVLHVSESRSAINENINLNLTQYQKDLSQHSGLLTDAESTNLSLSATENYAAFSADIDHTLTGYVHELADLKSEEVLSTTKNTVTKTWSETKDSYDRRIEAIALKNKQLRSTPIGFLFLSIQQFLIHEKLAMSGSGRFRVFAQGRTQQKPSLFKPSFFSNRSTPPNNISSQGPKMGNEKLKLR